VRACNRRRSPLRADVDPGRKYISE
jgi:hypothetical protein